MCLLVALFYVKACSRATRAKQAKHVDVESLQDLETMQTMHDDVVVVCRQASTSDHETTPLVLL